MAKPDEMYDAIVVGSGISGGWAAKELCENGMKTLVLERGRMIKHIEDYPTANMDPWDFKFKGQLPLEEQKKIAQILSTWDEAIDAVDELIEKKKDQKKVLAEAGAI